MKTILFFRHAKSDWDADFAHDHERPLAKRGQKAAKAMGRLLAEIGAVPDAVVTSSAVRAQETLRLARKAGAWEVPIRVTDALYQAAPEGVLEVLRAEPDTTESLLLVGHEPTWSATVGALIGGGSVRVPTACVARVDLDVARWEEVRFGQGQLIWLLPPKLFP